MYFYIPSRGGKLLALTAARIILHMKMVHSHFAKAAGPFPKVTGKQLNSRLWEGTGKTPSTELPELLLPGL